MAKLKIRRYISKRSVLLFLLILVGIFFTPQLVLMLRYKERIYTNVNDIPYREYAIVFGARVNQDGLSDVTRERIAAAVLLYQQGKVKKLFISGDNRHNQEVEAIARYATEQGVPESDLILDLLGIDTNDTCRHFKEVSHEGILVTQNFHLPRSLFNCEQSQIQGIGLAANNLGLLAARGDGVVQIYSIRFFRFFKESLLTWMFISGVYDSFSNEAEIIEKRK